MKFITIPTINQEYFEVPPPFREKVKAWWNNTIAPPRVFAGRQTWDNCIIEFDSPIMFGDKIDEITVGNVTAFGVIPIKQIAPNQYECSIDFAEIIL